MQQSYAKVSGVFENLPAHRLVEDAIAMNIGAFERHGSSRARILSRCRWCESIATRSCKYSSISFATRSMRSMSANGPISASHSPSCAVNERDTFTSLLPIMASAFRQKISRAFSPTALPRAKNGHGFGLHSGALAAQAMGGSLSVASAGPGQGATFTLEFARRNRRAKRHEHSIHIPTGEPPHPHHRRQSVHPRGFPQDSRPSRRPTRRRTRCRRSRALRR